MLEIAQKYVADRALNAHRRIWNTPFIEEMREWNTEGTVHDDGLDAVAGCLSSEPIRFTQAYADKGDYKRFSWQGTSGQFKAQTNFSI